MNLKTEGGTVIRVCVVFVQESPVILNIWGSFGLSDRCRLSRKEIRLYPCLSLWNIGT